MRALPEHAFDLPRRVVRPVSRIDVRLVDGPHPFEAANSEAIAANWREEVARNPALFDGEMVLLSHLRLDGETLTGRCHAVRYACMLYWRRHRGRAGIEHAFAFPALVSADGALIAVRMAAHTANAGKVYFAAGSFEPSDFVDGRVDLHGNMRREVLEETGLDLDLLRRDAVDHVYSEDGATVFFRRYWLEGTAAEIAGRIEDFVAAEREPEIEGPVVIASADERHDGMTPHMQAIVQWHFGIRSRTGCGTAPPSRPRPAV